MKKNLYKVLGVDTKADPSKIKGAYRKAAKRYHPDISPKGEKKFREIQEAYETLSDPEKKAIYDRESVDRAPAKTSHYSPAPMFRKSHNIFESPFEHIDRLFDEWTGFITEELFGSFDEETKRAGGLLAELILTPREASEGGRFFLPVSFLSLCSRCYGRGRVKGLICGLCRGEGEIRFQKEIEIRIPPAVKEGTEIGLEIPISDARPVHLTIVTKITEP